MPTGILLIAHGSRRKEANDELLRVAETLRQRRPEVIVEPAYLELAEPSIPEGARRCVDRGATRVQLLPYFLSPGVHVTEDLEQHRADFEQAYPDVVFTVCRPLGGHPDIAGILLDLLDEQQ